jgi:hypothetical protein
MANHCNPAEQEFRQGLLDLAFHLDGRDSPSHPFYSTYTALSTTDVYQQCLTTHQPPTPLKTCSVNGGATVTPMPHPSTTPPQA